MKNEYTPTTIDITWANNLIKITANNAVWGWPDTGLLYRISHETKCLILLNPDLLTDPRAENGHDRTIVVFKKVGYDVKLLDK